MSDLISKAILEMKNITYEEIQIESKDYIELINLNNMESLLNKEIYEILPIEIKNKLDLVSKSNKIQVLAKYLRIIQYFSIQARRDIKYLWPVSVIIYYLRLKMDVLPKILDNKEIAEINNLIFDLLLKITDSIEGNKAPFNEKEALKLYQNGKENYNLSHVYYLIDGIERGKGLYFSHFISFLLNFLLFNKTLFFEIFESLKEPVPIVKYLKSLDNKWNNEYINLILKSENPWLIFEYLRQIFSDNNLNMKNIDDFDSIYPLFSNLYHIDETFLINSINYLAKIRNKGYLGITVGKFLSKLNNYDATLKIIDSFTINNNEFYSDFWTKINQILEKENKSLSLFINQYIFKIWATFLKAQFKSDSILTNLILTDFKWIVVSYFKESLLISEIDFLKDLNEILDALINYKSYWITHPSRKRFICLSYLYLMSFAWKVTHTKEIDKLSEDKICYILDDKRLYISLPFNNEDYELISKIKPNFNIIS